MTVQSRTPELPKTRNRLPRLTLASIAAVALAFTSVSAVNAWNMPAVPDGEYDVVALDQNFHLNSYDHENEEWYVSSDKYFNVSHYTIPEDEDIVGYATTGGGFRNENRENVDIKIALVAAPLPNSAIEIGSPADGVNQTWSLHGVNSGDGDTLIPEFHEHFTWRFSDRGDYAIVVYAFGQESGLTAVQRYFFTVSP